MHSICLSTSFTRISRIFGSLRANRIKGLSWQAESLSHMAGISPVITNTDPSGLIRIVFSRVSRMQFVNISASLLYSGNDLRISSAASCRLKFFPFSIRFPPLFLSFPGRSSLPDRNPVLRRQIHQISFFHSVSVHKFIKLLHRHIDPQVAERM